MYLPPASSQSGDGTCQASAARTRSSGGRSFCHAFSAFGLPTLRGYARQKSTKSGGRVFPWISFEERSGRGELLRTGEEGIKIRDPDTDPGSETDAPLPPTGLPVGLPVVTGGVTGNFSLDSTGSTGTGGVTGGCPWLPVVTGDLRVPRISRSSVFQTSPQSRHRTTRKRTPPNGKVFTTSVRRHSSQVTVGPPGASRPGPGRR